MNRQYYKEAQTLMRFDEIFDDGVSFKSTYSLSEQAPQERLEYHFMVRLGKELSRGQKIEFDIIYDTWRRIKNKLKSQLECNTDAGTSISGGKGQKRQRGVGLKYRIDGVLSFKRSKLS